MQGQFKIEDVVRLCNLKESQVRYLERINLVRPSGVDSKGAKAYTFQDIISFKVIKGLMDSGHSFRRIRAAIEALRALFPRAGSPFAELRFVSYIDRIVAQGEEGCFEPSGQFLLPFQRVPIRRLGEPSATKKVDSIKDTYTADDWFERANLLDSNPSLLEEAEEAYKKAIELDPELVEAYVNLGRLHYNKGELDVAMQLFEKALDLCHECVESYYNIAVILEEQGELRAAVVFYRRALSIDGTYAEAHFNLAAVLERMSRHMEAKTHWQAYLMLDPESEWAELARSYLKE